MVLVRASYHPSPLNIQLSVLDEHAALDPFPIFSAGYRDILLPSVCAVHRVSYSFGEVLLVGRDC